MSSFAGRVLYGESQLKQLSDELVQIAKKLSPSVVVIEVPGGDGPRIIRREGGNAEGAWRVEVRTPARPGGGAPILGSGVIMSPDGLILTSAKHFQGRTEAKPKVKLADGREFEGKLTGLDKRTGLAVVKIDARNLSAVALAEKTPPVGSLVLAVSNTAGLGRSVSLGIVSGTDRVVAGEGPSVLGSATQYTGLLQITNPVGASDAGGLVADLDGKMVGMLHSSLTGRAWMPQPFRREGAAGVQIFGLGPIGPPTVQGVSFAAPAGVVRRVFAPLSRGEKVKWGYLGVYFSVAGDEGLRVEKLVADGPAAAAGLKEDDVIRSLAVPGKDTLKLKGVPDEVGLFARAIGWASSGTEVTLGLTREGRQEELKVKLGTAPEMPEQEVMVFDPQRKFGMEGPMGRGERAWLGIQLEAADGGVRIAAVIPQSPAQRHGLRVGDLVLRIGDRETRTPAALNAEVEKQKPGARISIALRRGDQEIVADVELGREPVQRWHVFNMPGLAQLGVEAKDGEEGLRITRVLEGSAAEKAGLKEGDIVVRADDRDIAGLGDLREIVRRHEPDDEVTLTVRRGEKELDLKVKLGRRPYWRPWQP
ncbi:MAG: hypothetical protein AMK75_06720 [Planctomycetes bacterium SM23_65]|nr:MAG: hypothetical protein AMK75_06720 [Planctomycetes bacterium SM23_65]